MTSLLSIQTSPEEISSKPATIRRILDFPHPEGPTKTKNSLSAISKLTLLTAVDPPFAPTILGLYRGAPVGEKGDEPRSIVLYRKNLARAVSDRGDLEKQVRITLWHELGHLRGEDEDELRARGLE